MIFCAQVLVILVICLIIGCLQPVDLLRQTLQFLLDPLLVCLRRDSWRKGKYSQNIIVIFRVNQIVFIGSPVGNVFHQQLVILRSSVH